MNEIRVAGGRRAGTIGCLIAAIPLLIIGGVVFVVWAIAGAIGTALLPTSATRPTQIIVGFLVIWLVLRVRRAMRRRKIAKMVADRSDIIDV